MIICKSNLQNEIGKYLPNSWVSDESHMKLYIRPITIDLSTIIIRTFVIVISSQGFEASDHVWLGIEVKSTTILVN